MNMARRHSRLRNACLAVVALSTASCGDSLAPGADEPAGLLIVSGNEQRSTVGERLAAPLVVRAVSARYAPVAGAVVVFTVVTGGGTVSRASVLSRSDGTAETTWTLGHRTADPQRVQARLAGGGAVAAATTVTFSAIPTAGPPTSITAFAGNGQRRPPGAMLRDSLVARVHDAFGNPVPNVEVTWRVTAGGGAVAPVASRTDSGGAARASWTLGPAGGAQIAQATIGAQSAAALFEAETVPRPTIAHISPDPAVAGAIVTLSGAHLGPFADEVRVAFNGSSAEVEYADSTQIRVRAPCEPSGPATLTVHANGTTVDATHALRVPDPLALGIGEADSIGTGSLCREVTGAGRYLLAIVNATTAPGTTGFRLRGGTSVNPAPAASTTVLGTTEHPVRVTGLPRQEAIPAHHRILQENRRLVQRLGAPTMPDRSSSGISGAHHASIAVNDTVVVKIPDAAGSLCAIRAQIRARAVFVGTRTVMLEDIAAPLAGSMDATYRALANEIETIQWGIVQHNFGNPLAFDSRTDGDGRVHIVFSKAVNDFRTLAAFTSSGDLYPTSACAASNSAELIYGTVPTDARRGYGDGSLDNVDNWLRTVRAIMIHELKHVTAFAEKFSRNGTSAPRLEEPWLEEATAVIAEELFGRAIYGYRQHGNTTYEQSLFCETRPDPASDPPECWHKPLVMYNYFALWYGYLAAIRSLSPFGAAGGADDATFYGSSWSLLRWAADQFASDESAFLRALIQEPTLRGVANLETRTGRPLADLLADWVLASAVDDRADVSGSRPIHSHPSWNARDVHAGMRRDSPTEFDTTFPLTPHVLHPGAFVVDVPGLQYGSTAVFEITVQDTVPQLLHLTPLPPSDSPDPRLSARLLRIH